MNPEPPPLPGWGQAGAQAGQNPTLAFPAAAGPTPRRRRRGLLIGTAAGVVVIAAIAVAIVIPLTRGDSPATMARQAGRAIGTADAISYAGTFAARPTHLSVTRAGTAEGTYTRLGVPVGRVTIGGTTYLKAPTAFWLEDEQDHLGLAQYLANRWVKAPDDAITMSVASLTPVRLGRVLTRVGPKPDATASTFHGTKVIVLVSDRVSYYITAARPHRLIHVAGISGFDSFSLDVTPLTAATVKPTFATLRADVQALAGAPDPNSFVNVLGDNKIVDCTTLARCGVAGMMRVIYSGRHDFATSPVMVKMTVAFSATKGSKTFTSCSVTVPVPSAATVRPVCEVHGSAWTHWVISQRGEFWTNAVYDVEVNSASAIAALQSRLSQEPGAS